MTSYIIPNTPGFTITIDKTVFPREIAADSVVATITVTMDSPNSESWIFLEEAMGNFVLRYTGQLQHTVPDAVGGLETIEIAGFEESDGSAITLELVAKSDMILEGDELPVAFNVADWVATWQNATASLTVEVDDGEVENTAPSDITLSNTTLLESARTGATVGILSATDADGDAIAYTLPSGGDNSRFALKTLSDGTVSVVLKSTLDHEASGGIYDLVVEATDSAGNAFTQTIAITVVDDPFKLSAVPTGKDYAAVMENTPEGTKIGFVMQFDTSFVPATVEVSNDPDGKFSVTTGEISGQTYYFLTVNGSLDHEADDLHEVTLKATDANGVSHEKTFQVHVLDAPEATDANLESRGTITIDANTALASANGGIDWNTYLDEAFASIVAGLPAFMPSGSGWSPTTPSNEFVYTNTTDGSMISLKGSNLVYNWTDPVSGEDAHVVSGVTNELVFGTGNTSTFELTNPELTISGLDLSNDSTLMNRIWGETQLFAQAWMYGLNGSTPADIEYVKAMLATYAQNFKGSTGNDTYTGTLFDDVIAGNGGNDVLDGNHGNDTINGGDGDDVIDGGEGNDTAIFTGNKTDYALNKNTDGTWTVTDNRSGNINDGVDTLKSIESAKFADEAVSLEDAGPEQPPVITIDASASASGVNYNTFIADYLNALTGASYKFYGGTPDSLYGQPYYMNGDQLAFQYANSNARVVLEGDELAYDWIHYGQSAPHALSGSIDSVIFGNWVDGVTTATEGNGAAGLIQGLDTQLVISGLGIDVAAKTGSTADNYVMQLYGYLLGNSSSDVAGLYDFFAGYAQNFIGSAQDDIYRGTRFDDTIDGGDGEDVVVYSADRSSYTVTRNADGTWTVTDIIDDDIAHGTDTLRNVETLQFTDGTLSLVVEEPSNTDPTSLSLSASVIAEDAAVGTVVGELSASDADGDTLTYTLIDDASGKFSLVTESGVTKLVVSGPLDHETAPGHQVTVKVEDGNGGIATETFAVSVTDVVEHINSAPSNVSLSASTIAENAANGTVIGTLSATDADGDTLTYTLTDDAGGKFALVTQNGVTTLVVNGPLDFETATGHQVSVKVADGNGGETTQSFNVGVTDVDDAPSAGTITIDASGSSGMNFESYIRGGFLVGAPNSGYPVFDNSGSFDGEEMLISYGTGTSAKYVLMHGSLSYNFGYHTIGGTANTIEYGTRGSGSYDANGYFVGGSAELTITGLNLSNAIPTNPTEEAAIEAKGVIHNFTAAHMKGSDAEAARLAIYANALDAYAQNFIGSSGSDVYAGTRFDDTIAGNGGRDVFDGGDGSDLIIFGGTKAEYAIAKDGTSGYVTVTEVSSGTVTTLANIETARFADGTTDLVNLEESDNNAPTGLELSVSSVAENAAVDTVIGALSATDVDGDVLTYTLTDDAQGRFKLVTSDGITQLVLAAAVDYETATSHPVTVQVSDGKGGVAIQTFIIDVLDIDDGNTVGDITLSGTAIAEDASLGAVVGRLSLADADGTVTWSLSGGAGKFAIETNGRGVARLVVDGELDYETRTSYELTLTAEEGGTETSETFTIDVTDVAELVKGTTGNDRLRGDATADILKGGAGNDTLIGGGGADRLTGGTGADLFVFTAISQSTPDSFDVITDFKGRQGDRIDLSGIDAVHGVSGNQAFDFIGRGDFSGTAGELRFETTSKRTIIEGDVDGDGNADFMVQILGTLNMKEEFFFL